ncbi:hypothetical protein ACFV5G_05205 [Streptomyces sp. NPDC059766]|uniref:hypothetical protein n=1 Tax=Streptomyces sp. NPDC059766 TaxID=3346940 RepID=UPI003655A624
MNDSEAPVYEVLYGFDRRTTSVLAISALFSVLLLVPSVDMPLGLRIVGILLFGGGGLIMAAGALTRKTAFRVDATGILLGGSPVRYRATTAHVPWQDITAVVLWQQPVPHSVLPWVGVARREGAPPLPGSGQGHIARSIGEALTPVPAELLVASRAMTGWRLDRSRLAAAVEYFAPGIQVVEYMP